MGSEFFCKHKASSTFEKSFKALNFKKSSKKIKIKMKRFNTFSDLAALQSVRSDGEVHWCGDDFRFLRLEVKQSTENDVTQFNKAEEKITFQQNQELRKQRSLFF